ncbi:galactose oxidase [Vulcanococcus limneticus]|uniref:galactose oxidase n=1 Tax=Vulcanococcus limneticus TaxID=2170428 RepID=UPI00398C23A5
MAVPSPVSAEPCTEDWLYLDQDVLQASRNRQACITCHLCRHHAGASYIPLLTCQLHRGLIAHGAHLTSRCHAWTDDQARQRGWAPEGA